MGATSRNINSSSLQLVADQIKVALISIYVEFVQRLYIIAIPTTIMGSNNAVFI